MSWCEGEWAGGGRWPGAGAWRRAMATPLPGRWRPPCRWPAASSRCTAPSRTAVPGLQNELQAIAIEPIPDRIGHYLGDDLVFDLNGTGSHVPPKYRLFVNLTEGVQTPLIDTVSGRASSATVVINANYRLVTSDTGLPLTRGTAFVFKSYDRTSERFANIRAARDAEIQDAKQLSDQLRIRLAAFFNDFRKPRVGN